MSSSAFAKSKQHSLTYGRNKAAFIARLTRPPLNPIADATPFSKLTSITSLPTLLEDFVTVMKDVQFHDRAISKMEKLIRWFPSWQAQQPPYILQCYTVRNVSDIRALIRDIAAAHCGKSDEQYLEYQLEWPWVHAVFVAMVKKSKWHPQCIWHSALWHSDYYGGGQSPRARCLLPKCFIMPSIYGHVAAHEAKTHDVRTYYAYDPAVYGGSKVHKTCNRKHHCQSDAGRLLLGAVPICSQQVMQRQRMRKTLKKVSKKSEKDCKQIRKLEFWFKSARRKH